MRSTAKFMRPCPDGRAGRSLLSRWLALLCAAALLISCAACVAEGDVDAAQSQSVNMTSGDITIGYIAQGGAWVNPFRCNDRDLVSLNQLVFESVIELNENMQPTPLLADSWSVQDKTWTFKLRSEVYFHSGEEMVAADVVASYEMFMQMENSDNPYTYRLALISSMEAVDAFTLKVTGYYSGMLTLYAMTFPVVQRNTLTEELPRGTGPYWYIRYDQNNAIRLESNPFWWKEQPHIGSVVAIRFDDTSYALEALQMGFIDTFSTRLSSAALSRKLSDLMHMDYTTTVYEMLVPNLSSSSYMSDLRVRQAVMYAIDRTTLVSNAYLDMALQSEVPIVPGTWIYESQSAIYNYSPERALQLLNEAGWSNLGGAAIISRYTAMNLIEDLELTIITYDESSSSVRGNAAELIAQNLRSIGIQVTVKVMTQENVTKAISKREYDLALVAVNLSEVPYLVPLFSDGGKLNYAKYSNTEMDRLLASTVAAADEEALRRAYSDVQMHIVNELPIMGLLFRTGTLLSTRQLNGLSGIRESAVLRGLEFVAKE